MKILPRNSFVLLMSIIVGCSHPERKEEIIPVDFLSIMKPDLVNGETQKQTLAKSAKAFKLIDFNTVNKYIPRDIVVQSPEGINIKLIDLINKPTILTSVDLHCGFGKESVSTIFPNSLDSLRKLKNDYNAICLVKIRDIDEGFDFEKDWFTNTCKERYSENLYFIQDSVAYQMNLWGNPDRLYINSETKVIAKSGGMLELLDQIKEIRKYTSLNNGYK